jgi:hypothetical protein
MDWNERKFWARVEHRLGEMVGEALAEQGITQQREEQLAWIIGLLRAWEQVKEIRATGRVLRFDEPTQFVPAEERQL